MVYPRLAQVPGSYPRFCPDAGRVANAFYFPRHYRLPEQVFRYSRARAEAVARDVFYHLTNYAAFAQPARLARHFLGGMEACAPLYHARGLKVDSSAERRVEARGLHVAEVGLPLGERAVQRR